MSNFSKLLREGRFVITAELNPPRGINVGDIIATAENLKNEIDAFNVTDQHASTMSLGPVGVCRILKEKGIDSILQMTCRDRNRIALQSDLLTAGLLGIENVLCLTGDPVSIGNDAGAQPVFDVDSTGLLEVATVLQSGKDMQGNDLNGTPSFFLGAVVNPSAVDLDSEIRRMERKVESGARFFQTQAIFDLDAFRRFTEASNHIKVPILAGVLLLKSGAMARRLVHMLPDFSVPSDIIDYLDTAKEKQQQSVEIAVNIINNVKEVSQGIHIMSLGWEKLIPNILAKALLNIER